MIPNFTGWRFKILLKWTFTADVLCDIRWPWCCKFGWLWPRIWFNKQDVCTMHVHTTKRKMSCIFDRISHSVIISVFSSHSYHDSDHDFTRSKRRQNDLQLNIAWSRSECTQYAYRATSSIVIAERPIYLASIQFKTHRIYLAKWIIESHSCDSMQEFAGNGIVYAISGAV